MIIYVRFFHHRPRGLNYRYHHQTSTANGYGSSTRLAGTVLTVVTTRPLVAAPEHRSGFAVLQQQQLQRMEPLPLPHFFRWKQWAPLVGRG